VRELIETERNYYDSLLICDEVYYRPLDASASSKAPLIDLPTLEQLFGNIDEIRSLHQTIVRAMNAALPRLNAPFPPKATYLGLIGPLSDLVPRMAQLYTQYLTSNENAEEILKRLRRGKKFAGFLTSCLFNPRAKCHEIEDLLILPTQRIGGYKLLIERALRYFPPETFGDVRQAYTQTLNALMGLGAAMNAEKGEQGGQEKLLTIAENLSKMPPFLLLLRPGRRYVSCAKMREFTADGHRGPGLRVYITSDILILGKNAESGRVGKWIFADAIPIVQVRFQEFPQERYAERGFRLLSDTAKYVCLMKTPEKKASFIETITNMKGDLQKTISRQITEGTEYMQGMFSQLSHMYDDPIAMPTREQALLSLE
jgi:hypothetical protein